MGSFPRTPFFFSSLLWRWCWQVALYASINKKWNVMHLNIIWKTYLLHCASPQSIQPSMHVLKVVNSQSADYDRLDRDKISSQYSFLSHGELSSLQQRWNIPYSWYVCVWRGEPLQNKSNKVIQFGFSSIKKSLSTLIILNYK